MSKNQKPIPPDDWKTPHGRLRWARAAARLRSTAEAALRFDWTEVTARAHENGTRGLRLPAAKQYAKAYGVSWAWLMNGGEDPYAAMPPPEPSEDSHERPSTRGLHPSLKKYLFDVLERVAKREDPELLRMYLSFAYLHDEWVTAGAKTFDPSAFLARAQKLIEQYDLPASATKRRTRK